MHNVKHITIAITTKKSSFRSSRILDIFIGTRISIRLIGGSSKSELTRVASHIYEWFWLFYVRCSKGIYYHNIHLCRKLDYFRSRDFLRSVLRDFYITWSPFENGFKGNSKEKLIVLFVAPGIQNRINWAVGKLSMVICLHVTVSTCRKYCTNENIKHEIIPFIIEKKHKLLVCIL